MVAGARFGGPGSGGPGRFGSGGGMPPAGAFGAPPGGMGGLRNASTPSSELVTLLTNSNGYRWAAATVGSNNAAGYQLASRKPVMAIGGFNGSDPSSTLAQFQQYVAQHQIHHFIGGGRDNAGGPGGESTIEQWVAANDTATTVGGVTVYDLS